MLELKNVTLGYRNKKEEYRVLRNFNFSMRKGHFLGILGPSGCGKTTLLNSLATVLPPLEGEILLEGQRISAENVAIGLIPQNYGLLPWKTVEENGLLGVRLREGKSFKNKEASYREQLRELAKRLSVEEFLERYPGSLSGGQAQRIALLRALLMKPELLLMDEPFAALDAAASISAASLCLDLWQEYRPTTVMVTHRLEEALFLATDLIVMNQQGELSCQYENPWQGKVDCREDAYFELQQKLRQAVLAAGQTKGKDLTAGQLTGKVGR